MTHFWWAWVLPAALQATPLLLLAAALDLLLPRLLDPRWRAGIWLLAALKLAAPFEAGGVLPNPVAGVPPAWTAFVPATWLCGAALLILGSAVWFRRQRAALRPVECRGLSREVFRSLAPEFGAVARIVESDRLDGPVTIGQTVYWPAGLENRLSEAEQRQVLRHELAHVVRRDGWRELGWSALVAVFWFHPLVWWAARRMRAIREECCDRTAAELPGHCAETYRRALLRVLGWVHALAPGMALVDPRMPLTNRLALLEQRPHSHWRGIAALAALAIVWPLARWANQESHAVAEWVARPPGSLQLRYMVLERLAEENGK
ncbi:MAG: M56 family metallopeptidase [Acidobacteria bacterium]|nr:M56 family metallopeptidase [Acidobacteriota bacterium]